MPLNQLKQNVARDLEQAPHDVEGNDYDIKDLLILAIRIAIKHLTNEQLFVLLEKYVFSCEASKQTLERFKDELAYIERENRGNVRHLHESTIELALRPLSANPKMLMCDNIQLLQEILFVAIDMCSSEPNRLFSDFESLYFGRVDVVRLDMQNAYQTRH
ncbi:hypothetical protein GT360_17790 [Vibrio astriarenae]|uniref:Uncharacterized protein n=1 Tax=Vibrio astriarenae TaxID=1481923 RepID=A0A7Z2T732_9VIBR|nr:hypothetical protein [Vibrio astriarenae]QIA65392.1 hypothetical protein GT360_17790 [Vibrio astriarenae]